MNLLKSMARASRGSGAIIAAALVSVASASAASATTQYDLTVGDGTANPNTRLDVPGEFGGTAIFADYFVQPVGTGVFKPFLDLKSPANSSIEGAYNSDHPKTDLDQHRAPWNHSIKFGDLADIMIDGTKYYGFILDANEPGGSKSLISVDNFRVYTSKTDNTGSVNDDVTKLGLLGTLRWALNDPVLNGSSNPVVDDGYNIEPWVKLDADQGNVGRKANGGSGIADMIVYIPAADFGDTAADDYVWVYNLNGVHYAADADLGATSGFEEWSYISGPHTNVPDGGVTIGLLGLGLLGLGAVRRKLS